MNLFASGQQKTYYGKGDVVVYRLNRDGKQAVGENPVFGANVKMLLYGDAFWPTYTTGDNTNLIATDSMKNFIQRETMNFAGYDLEPYCEFLAKKMLSIYPQIEGVQVSAEEIPYASIAETSFQPAGPERVNAVIEISRIGVVEARSGIRGFRLLRLNGSAFFGFVKDGYTTLPDIKNRPLHMWLDLEWKQLPESRPVTKEVRDIVRGVFAGFESGSIQQVIFAMGKKMLAEIPTVSEVRLEANNRTWDTVGEEGDALGVYTEARPPYGCLGLTLTR